MTPLRVMVVDDSVSRREQLVSLVEGTRLATVVGTASDGAEAMRMLDSLRPDVITLDLEMPRLDGFSFLRLMMSTRPTPVIVVSSNNKRDAVFKALEFGALDFIAVPEGSLNENAHEALSQKLLSIRAVRSEHLAVQSPPPIVSRRVDPRGVYKKPASLVVIAASTGGPTALTKIVSQLEASSEYAVLIAQHMPGSFTGPFADRLNRYSAFEVREGVDGESIRGGTVLVCPGHQCMEVVDDANLRVRLRTPSLSERYVPSADRLLSAAAHAYGRRVVAVILTGMGDDGAKGARQVSQAGGRVLVESEATSVVYGMPRAALGEVPTSQSVPIHDMATWIERMVNIVGPR